MLLLLEAEQQHNNNDSFSYFELQRITVRSGTIYFPVYFVKEVGPSLQTNQAFLLPGLLTGSSQVSGISILQLPHKPIPQRTIASQDNWRGMSYRSQRASIP